MVFTCPWKQPDFLNQIFLNPDTTDQPKSLVSESEGTREISVSQKNTPDVDRRGSSRSPKRQNEEAISNPKRKVSEFHGVISILISISCLSFLHRLFSLCRSFIFFQVFAKVSCYQLKLTKVGLQGRILLWESELSQNAIVIFYYFLNSELS